MRKITTMLFMGALLAAPQFSKAQATEQGQVQITANAGYSLIGAIFSTTLDAAKASDPGIKGGGTPVINLMGDYMVGDNFSIGVAASYQRYSIRYTDQYAISNSLNDGNGYRDTWSCVNIGIRPLFHFGSNSSLDLYAGVRVSTTVWNFSSTAAGAVEDESISLPGVGVMPLFGGTYYFNETIGLNMELGIGTYLAAVGLNVRL